MGHLPLNPSLRQQIVLIYAMMNQWTFLMNGDIE
jgi:hypothetical protein